MIQREKCENPGFYGTQVRGIWVPNNHRVDFAPPPPRTRTVTPLVTPVETIILKKHKNTDDWLPFIILSSFWQRLFSMRISGCNCNLLWPYTLSGVGHDCKCSKLLLLHPHIILLYCFDVPVRFPNILTWPHLETFISYLHFWKLSCILVTRNGRTFKFQILSGVAFCP